MLTIPAITTHHNCQNKKQFAKNPVHFTQSPDLFFKTNEDLVVEKLKNPNRLYRIYSGQKTDVNPNVFNNEKIASKLYSDKEFFKSSRTALIMHFEDKLENEDLSEKEKEEITLLKSILEYHNQIEEETDFNENKAINYQPQLAFSGVLKMGLFSKPQTRREKAEMYVNRYSALAASSAALLAQTTIGDTAALTAITIKMCKAVCNTYEMSGGTTSALVSKVLGRIAGKKLASMAIKYIPGAGNAANATITYSLHQLTGRMLIDFCEKNYRNPSMGAADAASKFAIHLSNANDILDTVDEKINAGNPYRDLFNGSDIL